MALAKNKQIIVRINEKMKEQVRILAAENGVSISEYILDLLKQKIWEAEQNAKLQEQARQAAEKSLKKKSE